MCQRKIVAWVLCSASLRVVLGFVCGEYTVLRKMVIFYLPTSVRGTWCLTTWRNALLQSAQNRRGQSVHGARYSQSSSLRNDANHAQKCSIANHQLCHYVLCYVL